MYTTLDPIGLLSKAKPVLTTVSAKATPLTLSLLAPREEITPESLLATMDPLHSMDSPGRIMFVSAPPGAPTTLSSLLLRLRPVRTTLSALDLRLMEFWEWLDLSCLQASTTLSVLFSPRP